MSFACASFSISGGSSQRLQCARPIVSHIHGAVAELHDLRQPAQLQAPDYWQVEEKGTHA